MQNGVDDYMLEVVVQVWTLSQNWIILCYNNLFWAILLVLICTCEATSQIIFASPYIIAAIAWLRFINRSFCKSFHLCKFLSANLRLITTDANTATCNYNSRNQINQSFLSTTSLVQSNHLSPNPISQLFFYPNLHIIFCSFLTSTPFLLVSSGRPNYERALEIT